MDEQAVVVTINAGISLFGIIVINGHSRHFAGNDFINSSTHSRKNGNILKIVKGPSGEDSYTTNKTIPDDEKTRA